MSTLPSKVHIVFALYPGVTHLDFTGPHQVLVRTPDAEVVAASMGGQDIEAEGLVFSKLAALEAIPRCDVLCVPGGFGTTAAMLDEAFMAQIRRLGGGVTAGIDFALVLLEELAGRDYAEGVQLGLEYAPAPPFNSGRPELARPEVLARVQAMLDRALESRADGVAQAAGRMAVSG